MVNARGSVKFLRRYQWQHEPTTVVKSLWICNVVSDRRFQQLGYICMKVASQKVLDPTRETRRKF